MMFLLKLSLTWAGDSVYGEGWERTVVKAGPGMKDNYRQTLRRPSLKHMPQSSAR